MSECSHLGCHFQPTVRITAEITVSGFQDERDGVYGVEIDSCAIHESGGLAMYEDKNPSIIQGLLQHLAAGTNNERCSGTATFKIIGRSALTTGQTEDTP